MHAAKYVRRKIFIQSCLYCEQTAVPRSAKFCDHMHADKLPSHANFYPNRHFLDQGKQFESNTLASSHVKSAFVYRRIRYEMMGVVKSARNALQYLQARRTIPITTISRGVRSRCLSPICQGVLACNLILSDMQCIAFSSIAFVGRCLYVCVRPFECFIGGPHENGLR